MKNTMENHYAYYTTVSSTATNKRTLLASAAAALGQWRFDIDVTDAYWASNETAPDEHPRVVIEFYSTLPVDRGSLEQAIDVRVEELDCVLEPANPQEALPRHISQNNMNSSEQTDGRLDSLTPRIMQSSLCQVHQEMGYNPVTGSFIYGPVYVAHWQDTDTDQFEIIDDTHTGPKKPDFNETKQEITTFNDACDFLEQAAEQPAEQNTDITTNPVTLKNSGRYVNIKIGEQMIASYDKTTGELPVYDPRSDTGEPTTVIQTDHEQQQ